MCLCNTTEFIIGCDYRRKERMGEDNRFILPFAKYFEYHAVAINLASIGDSIRNCQSLIM